MRTKRDAWIADTPDDVAALVAAELLRIEDGVVREGLRTRLIPPTLHQRNWDYGAPGEQYPCWTIAADPGCDTALVFSNYGFGPTDPWGIVLLSRPWFGMDCGWYERLEDAFVNSWLASDLSIWNVVAHAVGKSPRIVESSLAFEAAYSIRDKLATQDPDGSYHVECRSAPPDGIP